MIRSEYLGLLKHNNNYLFNSIYNIEPSTMVTRHLKMCVSFAESGRYASSKTSNQPGYSPSPD